MHPELLIIGGWTRCGAYSYIFAHGTHTCRPCL